MKEFFIVFRSRVEAVRFYETLASYNISCKLINTPTSAQVGCGLSVKLFAKDMHQAKMLLMRGQFASVVGTYQFLANGVAAKV